MAPDRPPRVRLGRALRATFLLWTLVAVVHVNLVRPYVLGDAGVAARVGDSAAAQVPARAYDDAILAAERIGVAWLWRMYSPAPRFLRETRWDALSGDGEWVPVAASGISTAHRRRRSLAAALLWDFKRARVDANYFIRRYDQVLPDAYVMASRERIARELGYVPRALRVRVYQTRIPRPAAKGAWDPADAAFDRIAWERVFR